MCTILRPCSFEFVHAKKTLRSLLLPLMCKISASWGVGRIKKPTDCGTSLHISWLTCDEQIVPTKSADEVINNCFSDANVMRLSEGLRHISRFAAVVLWFVETVSYFLLLFFSHIFPFCFPNYSLRLEDFPTSPTSTAKQEFLYVESRVSLNQNRPDYTPPIHLRGLSPICAFSSVWSNISVSSRPKSQR